MNLRAAATAVVAFLGMVDAMFLASSHGPVPCRLTGGCNDVLHSAYSSVGGVPLPWFGLAFYLFAFSLAVLDLTGAGRALRWLFWPALAGFLVSVGLVGIQAFVLKAFCEYCLASAGLVTTIFAISMFSRLRPIPDILQRTPSPD
ncbi:MAG TPA: vitamin K epoxide reductase family protein [Terriglobia bacterium]|nr:vitamin K epoxide reductase family protein [Terriglobia bacterium]